MKHLLFSLYMPNPPTYNSKWLLEEEDHTVARSFTDSEFAKLPDNILGVHFFYWDDGWIAQIFVRQVDLREKRNRLKKSSGFCGYEWMVESLIERGKIIEGLIL